MANGVTGAALRYCNGVLVWCLVMRLYVCVCTCVLCIIIIDLWHVNICQDTIRSSSSGYVCICVYVFSICVMSLSMHACVYVRVHYWDYILAQTSCTDEWDRSECRWHIHTHAHLCMSTHTYTYIQGFRIDWQRSHLRWRRGARECSDHHTHSLHYRHRQRNHHCFIRYSCLFFFKNLTFFF